MRPFYNPKFCKNFLRMNPNFSKNKLQIEQMVILTTLFLNNNISINTTVYKISKEQQRIHNFHTILACKPQIDEVTELGVTQNIPLVNISRKKFQI